MAIERILLVRHGQTDWNVQGRWQGFEPVPLNEEGWSQARALARFLQGRPVGEIISSDLPRAFQTASAIGDAVGISPHTDERWREFNLGIFQGYTREILAEKFPAEWHDFHADYWDFHIPSGESRRNMQERVYSAWLDVISSATGPELVIVSHGGSLKMLLLKLFPDVPDLDAAHLGNTSLTIIERADFGWHLASLAAEDHLATSSVKASGEAAL